MANIAIFRINYKSDFILTLNSDAGWLTPFCIKFWTGAPSQAYFASFDGTTYTHCAPVEGEPTKLRVQFDDHHLLIGDLQFQIGYHFTVADFPTSVEDEVLNQASVIIEVGGEPAQVMLDFNGETAPEIEFSLPAYANEAQRIANEEQRIAAETQRIANEETRISAEQVRQQNETQRISREQARQTNETQRIEREQARQSNEEQRIANEAERVTEFAGIKTEAVAATNAANTAASLANEKAEYAQAQGDYAKAQGDTALADHERAEADHTTAAADHTQAVADHTQAGNDHTRAESDHTRAESDHAAVEVYVDSLGAFDISAYHATGGVLAKYADLAAALGTGGANIPDTLRKGGMSVKFVQSSDNKYVQCRFMLSGSFTNAQFENTANWQGVDDEPTAGSDNLVESGGVAKALNKVYGYLAQSTSAKITPTVDDGLVEGYSVAKNGNKNQAASFGYVQPILLPERATIILNEGNDVYWSNVAVVYECLQDGTFVKQLLGDGAYASKPASYTNNSDSDIYVGICTYKTTLNYRIVSLTKAASETELTTMKANEIKDWILGESFTVTNATYTDGIIGSPVSVTWPDGESGILTLVRDSDGLLTSITATYGTDTYVLTVTRDSDGNATNSTIVKQ